MKRIAIVLTVVLAGVLGFFLWNEYRGEQERQAQYEARERELRPLTVQYNDLQKQLTNLEELYKAKKEGIGTTSVIFVDMDERIYTDCYPVMKEKGYTGILAVSDTMFPGIEGCMSMEHFQELIQAGWTICLNWNAEQPIESWLPSVTENLAAIGMESGNIMYFPNGTYTQEYDAVLLEYGFTVAVHHGEEGRSMILSGDEDGVWHPGAVGLQGKEPKAKMQESVTGKGYLINVVGFRLEEDMYNDKMFRSMLDFCSEIEAKNSLMVMDINAAREYCRQRMMGYPDLEEEYRQQREELEKQIASMEERIEEFKVIYE